MSLGLLADAELHCGLPGQAIKSARDAISLQTIYPPQLIDLLAAAYRDNGQLDLSIPAAREAARLEPERTEALVTLCSDYALAGQTEQARRIAAEIVATDPGFRISAYAADHPYRDQSHLAGIVGALRSAGLPG
jgi:tetratricopeptide (TPR) repeat protein